MTSSLTLLLTVITYLTLPRRSSFLSVYTLDFSEPDFVGSVLYCAALSSFTIYSRSTSLPTGVLAVSAALTLVEAFFKRRCPHLPTERVKLVVRLSTISPDTHNIRAVFSAALHHESQPSSPPHSALACLSPTSPHAGPCNYLTSLSSKRHRFHTSLELPFPALPGYSFSSLLSYAFLGWTEDIKTSG